MRNATKIIASTFGLLAGLAGLEHGIGETLQGNHAPAGIMLESWPTSTSMRILGGEPAMTLIPNLLVTGILTILVSLILLGWVTKFVHRPHSGLILLLLSLMLLLVGGGFGPPVLGFIAAAVATGINASHRWWRTHLSVPIQRLLVSVWPWSFALCLGAWLLLFPGTMLIGYFFPLAGPGVIYTLILLAFGSLLVTIGLGFAHDSYGQAAPYGPSK